MPYFQRKPVEGLDDLVRSRVPTPGLPSRGPVAGPVADTGLPGDPHAAATGIVEQADAVLAAARARGGREAPAGLGSDAAPSALGQTADHLGAPGGGIVEEPVAVVVEQPLPEAPHDPPPSPATSASPDAEDLVIEPAPVLSTGPVAPGGTAETTISLINEDEQPAQVVFFSTALIGEGGACIPSECVSFRPSALTIEAGHAGKVSVSVAVPVQTRSGIYSGLIRASTLEHLHTVLVVQVENP